MKLQVNFCSLNVVEIQKTQVFADGLPLRQDMCMNQKSSYIGNELIVMLLKCYFFKKYWDFGKIILERSGQRFCFISKLFLQNTFESNIAIITLRSQYTHNLECLGKRQLEF